MHYPSRHFSLFQTILAYLVYLSKNQTIMKYLAIAALLLAATACKQKEAENNDATNKDTVVVHDTVQVKEEPKTETPSEPKNEKKTPTTQAPAAPTEKPWKSKMAQLHELNCKIHSNGATVSDRTDQVVLAKELKDIQKTLNKDDKFLFDADMVKAEDMSTCPK
jgi:hypothetical protein